MARIICVWMFVDPAMAAVPLQTVLRKTELPDSYIGFSDAGTNCPIRPGLKSDCECTHREIA